MTPASIATTIVDQASGVHSVATGVDRNYAIPSVATGVDRNYASFPGK